MADRVKQFLNDTIEILKEAKIERIERLLSTEAGFAYLKSFNQNDLDNIKNDADDTDILEEFEHLHAKNHIRSKRTAAEIIRSVELNEIDMEKLEKVCAEKVPDLLVVHQADLARYVGARAFVLSLLSRLLDKPEDGNYQKENAVHSLLFPLRKDDFSGAYHSVQHNLWLVDEKYAFYSYVASDKQLKNHQVMPSGSDDRPDIAAYFFGEAQAQAALEDVVVIELKRPWRKDFSGEKRDPVAQVRNYIKQVKGGSSLDYKGKKVPVTSQTRFFAHIICDTTSDYIQDLAGQCRMTELMGGQGYFAHFESERTYIELLHFNRVLNHAFLRNQAFLKQLGIDQKLIN